MVVSFGAGRRDAVEVVERDAPDRAAALRAGVTASEEATRGNQHRLVALERVGAGVEAIPWPCRGWVDGTDVVADHDVVAEAVARQALATAVADVVSPGHGSGAVGDSM